MLEVNIIGFDLAKNVFQAHGSDASGATLFRKKLRRDHVCEMASKTDVVLECAPEGGQIGLRN